jgi:hypothetical protein
LITDQVVEFLETPLGIGQRRRDRGFVGGNSPSAPGRRLR